MDTDEEANLARGYQFLKQISYRVFEYCLCTFNSQNVETEVNAIVYLRTSRKTPTVNSDHRISRDMEAPAIW